MNKPTDDLEAIRIIVSALEGFDSKDRERIIRWSQEKLGMDVTDPVNPQGVVLGTSSLSSQQQPTLPSTAKTGSKDIRSFVAEKNPSSDIQFAVVTTFYYQFEAKPEEHKTSVTKNDLANAYRHAGGRDIPKKPYLTLNNAVRSGYLEKTGDPGHFRLNSVGENLVRNVLPGNPERSQSRSKKQALVKKRKPTKSNSVSKKKKM